MDKLTKNETVELRRKHVGENCILFFSSDPLKIVKASGQYMYDEKGNKYLDCINNVCHVGHCHPRVVQAATDQMNVLNTNSRFLHDNLVLLAERISQTLPGDLSVVYFTNSGSEANDLALQMARHHTKATEVLAVEGAYHGHVTSLIDLSTYKMDDIKNGCHNRPDSVHVMSCPDMYRGKYRDDKYAEDKLGQMYAEDVQKSIDDIHTGGKKVSCFIAESLQSCGGQVIYPRGYLQKVFQSVHQAGGVCIVDEVQVGFGRVGTHFWAFESQGVVPDIVTMGKPMGNGHPVAALVTTPAIAASFNASGMEYFNTFGGNPVSCAIALAVLDIIRDEKLQEHALDIGTYFMDKMMDMKTKYSIIGDVRGEGMFVGIDLVKDRTTREPAPEEAKYVITRLKENHILYSRDGPDHNVLKFKPPLCFTRKNVDNLCSNFDLIFSEIKQGLHLDDCTPSPVKRVRVEKVDNSQKNGSIEEQTKVAMQAPHRAEVY